MDPLKIIEKYYSKNPKLLEVLVKHSSAVARKALEIVKKFPQVDKDFIYEASMLHDIGIIFTYIPKLNPEGKYPYIAHGYLGRALLEKEGLPKHALVCERHIGVGITKEEIIKKKLPLPERDMIPLTLEEKIIAFADKFFSKHPDGNVRKKSVDEIIENLRVHGEEKVKIFKEWLKLFEEERKDV
ncbi:MAG: phosphohydrolase [Thermodesulfobacterium geofontis]|uniref:Phosphohydrolase n=1 Tax=Thermodesulfobacterium geofontis TaxID=1295609 RepID=A0A2N7PMR0_9BACT|nr:MAG: phosphohydrolase [Thermodesulfobacterium geofontis]